MPAGITRLAVLICLILSAAASAAAADLFTVSGVAVEARAESTEAAKQKALVDAQRQALEALTAKLARRSDQAAVQYPDDAAIDAMIASTQVADEQTAPDGYRGVFSFEFEPEAVRGLLRRQQIPFTEARAGPMLVLPVLRTAGEPALWADPNPWLEAWERLDSSARLTPIRTPFGDVEDVLALSTEQALAGDEAAIEALADRHGVETVMVLDAALTIDREAGRTDMDVSMMSYGPEPYPLVTRGFSADTTEDVPLFLDRAVNGMVGEIDDLWKDAAIAGAGREQQALSALVPLGSLADWVDIAARIEAIHLVRRLQLEALNARGALVAIHHSGDTERLGRAAQRQGLGLEERPEGFWIVTSRGGPR